RRSRGTRSSWTVAQSRRRSFSPLRRYRRCRVRREHDIETPLLGWLLTSDRPSRSPSSRPSPAPRAPSIAQARRRSLSRSVAVGAQPGSHESKESFGLHLELVIDARLAVAQVDEEPAVAASSILVTGDRELPVPLELAELV